jgi:hypothetical protein
VTVLEISTALAQQPRRDGEDGHTDGNIDVEDPRPAERARQGASEQDAGSAPAARCGAPNAEREIALPALTEGRRQDRESGGRQQRSAEPLQRAERNQRSLRPGETVEQRANGEHDEAHHEEPAATQEIGKAATEKECSTEEDCVGGDHPLQALLGEVQVGLDRGQCNVHNRDVQHDHELSSDDHREGEPPPAVW